MKHEEYSEMIDAWLTGDVDAERAEALTAHWAECPDCRRQIQAVRETVGALDAEARGEARGLERVRFAVRREIQKERRMRVWFRRGGVAAAAAAAALALFTVSSGLIVRFTTADAPVFSVEWSRGGAYLCDRQDRPIIIDNLVFAMRRADGMYRMDAMHAETGGTVWQTDISPVHAVASCGDSIYTAAREGGRLCLNRINPRTGYQSRELTIESEAAPSRQIRLTALDDRLMIQEGRRLMAYDISRGALTWQTSWSVHEGMVSRPVAGPDGSIALATSARWMMLDAETGAVRETRPHPQGLSRYRTPEVIGDGERCWIAAHRADGKGYLARIDLRGGDVIWSRQAVSPYNVQQTGDMLLVRGEGLHALDAITGEERWTLPLHGCDRVAFHEGRILAFDGQEGHRILSIDPRTGKRTSSADFAASSCGGISVFGRRGYLIGNDGMLYALAL